MGSWPCSHCEHWEICAGNLLSLFTLAGSEEYTNYTVTLFCYSHRVRVLYKYCACQVLHLYEASYSLTAFVWLTNPKWSTSELSVLDIAAKVKPLQKLKPTEWGILYNNRLNMKRTMDIKYMIESINLVLRLWVLSKSHNTFQGKILKECRLKTHMRQEKRIVVDAVFQYNVYT